MLPFFRGEGDVVAQGHVSEFAQDSAAIAHQLRRRRPNRQVARRWRVDQHQQQEVDARFDTNLRYEYWDARAPEGAHIAASRSRLGLKYDWRNRFSAFVEPQFAVVTALTDNASGAAALYGADTESGAGETNSALKIAQLWLEVKPSHAPRLRIGREAINTGTLTTYPETEWAYLKKARLSQRLVGTVDWRHGARAYDGISGLLKLAGSDLHLFVAQPTIGEFPIRSSYEQQKDIMVGAADLTLRRGVGTENVQPTGFLLGYADSRDPSGVAGLFSDIRIFTLGGSVLGVYPTPGGRFDALLWGAY